MARLSWPGCRLMVANATGICKRSSIPVLTELDVRQLYIDRDLKDYQDKAKLEGETRLELATHGYT